MNYDVYKQNFDVNNFGMLIAAVVCAGMIGVLIIIMSSILRNDRKKAVMVMGAGVLVIIGAVIAGVLGTNHFVAKREAETARFTTWVEKNYDLNLTENEAVKLEFSDELIKEYEGQLQKLTLEKYQGGVVIMNDGKAIKQK